MKKRLLVVDISSFIFRAFYAIRPLNAPDGTPVNAVHGVLSMLLKLMASYKASNIILAKDSREQTFRKEMYPQYKANRSETPEDLIPQFEIIDQLIEEMGIPYCLVNRYEADDVVGSIVTQWRDLFDEIYIVSGDKDLMQFVDDKISMLDSMKDILYGRQEVFEKMGVWPEQIVDYLSITGDSSDNIPGMRGIGAKGAAKLLEQHKTLEGCIENAESFSNKRVKDAFANHLDDAFLSRKLIKIPTDIELGISAEDSRYCFRQTEQLKSFLLKYGLKSLVSKVESIKCEDDKPEVTVVEKKFSSKIEYDFHIIDNEESFNELLKLLEKINLVCVYPVYNSDDIHDSKIETLTISPDGKNSYFLSFKNDGDLFSSSTVNPIGEQHLIRLLDDLWGNSSKEIISFNVKRDFLFYADLGKKFVARYFDVAQALFIVNSGEKMTFSHMVSHYLGHTCQELDKSKKVSDLDLISASKYAGERIASLFLVAEILKRELDRLELMSVYRDLDAKLIPILAMIERSGIFLNASFFKELEIELSEKLLKIEDEIAQKTGEKINLKSPKQVGELLFGKLQYPVLRKIKTGYSTDSSVLEELDRMNIGPVPDMILQYRELEKILSTYVVALPKLISPKTNRLHTTFTQNIAATGRLSSVHPNLQNIPIKSDIGRRIRKGFVARPGMLLLSADYSQVELRILAHFSEDPVMLRAFNNGEDIHAQTAAEILHIGIKQVTDQQRKMAKAVNFGLMYGQSTFGLSQSLGIPRNEAKEYITNYFIKFSRVKTYLDCLIELCEEKGYAETLFGRKRFLPDIYSTNRNVKAFAQRVAVNSPIQGTAADIVKKAMIDICHDMEINKSKSRMLLQVHDELIFEVPEEELQEMQKIVKTRMENVVNLKVNLDVDIRAGINWFDLK